MGEVGQGQEIYPGYASRSDTRGLQGSQPQYANASIPRSSFRMQIGQQLGKSRVSTPHLVTPLWDFDPSPRAAVG